MLRELNRVIDYIEEHLTDEISLKSVADYARVSDFHFRKVFFYLSGMTLSEYINPGSIYRPGTAAEEAAGGRTRPAQEEKPGFWNGYVNYIVLLYAILWIIYKLIHITNTPHIQYNIIQFIGISFKIVFSPQKIYGKARSDVIITGIYFLIIIH